MTDNIVCTGNVLALGRDGRGLNGAEGAAEHGLRLSLPKSAVRARLEFKANERDKSMPLVCGSVLLEGAFQRDRTGLYPCIVGRGDWTGQLVLVRTWDMCLAAKWSDPYGIGDFGHGGICPEGPVVELCGNDPHVKIQIFVVEDGGSLLVTDGKRYMLFAVSGVSISGTPADAHTLAVILARSAEFCRTPSHAYLKRTKTALKTLGFQELWTDELARKLHKLGKH